MNGWLHVFARWVSALCLPLLVAGCVKDDLSSEVTGGRQELRLSLPVYMADPNATTDESAIRSVYVYIFNENDVLENSGSVVVSGTPLLDDTGVLNASWRVTAGEKTIFVIANPPASIAAGLPTANPVAKGDIEGQSAGRGDFLEDLKKLAARGLVMTGSVQTTVPTGDVPHTASVSIARRHARIDLNLRPSEEMIDRRITIKKATLRRQNWNLPLFRNPSGATEDSESRSIDVQVGADAGHYTSVCSFYTGMRPLKADTKPLCLDLETEIDGKTIPMQVFLNTGALNGGTANEDKNPIGIEPNHIYRIDGTITPKTTSFEIGIQDWTDEKVNGDIGGSTLELDSVVLVKAGRETLVPVRTIADTVSVELSSAAKEVGYALTGADPSTGVLDIRTRGQVKVRIPITGPVAYPIGEEYYMTVSAGNIRRRVPLQVDATHVFRLEENKISVPATRSITDTYVNADTYVVLNGTDTKIRVPCEIDFSADDGKTWSKNLPDMVYQYTYIDPINTLQECMHIRIKGQKSVTSYFHDEALQAAPPVSGYDLSTKGGTAAMQTANCYIVNAPGSYSLPLVYGNAIDWVKNPADGNNTSAYKSEVSSNLILKTFLNHLDAPITSPYIYNNDGCAPKDAVLVWQDEANLVSNVALGADGRTLTFDVPQATIKQGNAVVAVRDADGRIMWSWHIWVTDYVPGLSADIADPMRDKVMTNHNGKQYTVMPLFVGWCAPATKVYPERSMKVRITQRGTGAIQICTISQEELRVDQQGNCTTFQFGRKDPILPGIYDQDARVVSDKTCYYTDAGYAFGLQNGAVSIGTAIQQPNKMFVKTGTLPWYDAQASIPGFPDKFIRNLWNTNFISNTGSDDPVVKTIYDPSPAGNCLPPAKAFSGVVFNGKSASGSSSYLKRFNSPNTVGNTMLDNNGWTFYCNKMLGEGVFDPTGGTIFFPLHYSRRKAGGDLSTGIDVSAWAGERTSSYFSTSYYEYGYQAISYAAEEVSANSSSLVNMGHGVRPVKEK